jgi:hypothetical protein
MREIIIDGETHEVVDELAVKNQEIISALSERYEALCEENKKTLAFRKQPKLGYRFFKSLYAELIKYPKMEVKKFAQMDYDTLNYYWIHYCELTAYYNEKFETIDNKQLFQIYCGINPRQYEQLEKHEDEEVRNLMLTINAIFVGQGFMATESGNADSKSVEMRLKANAVGHSVTSAVEERVLNGNIGFSEKDAINQLEALGIDTRLLKGGK